MDKKVTYILGGIILLALSLLSNRTTIAQKTSYSYLKAVNIDIAADVTPTEIGITYTLYIPRLRAAKSIEGVYFICEVKSDLDNTTLFVDTLSIDEVNPRKTGTQWVGEFNIDTFDADKAIVSVTAVDSKTNQRGFQNLTLTKSKPSDAISLKKAKGGSLGRYAFVGEKLKVSHLHDVNIYIYRFNHAFSPSLPPMITEGTSTNTDLNPDSLMVIRSNQPFTLDKLGLYFAQTDTSTLQGIPIMVVVKDFPKYRKIYHVVHPLVYISTQQELVDLTASLDDNRLSKKALDNF